jgi:hypothetical protein
MNALIVLVVLVVLEAWIISGLAPTWREPDGY